MNSGGGAAAVTSATGAAAASTSSCEACQVDVAAAALSITAINQYGRLCVTSYENVNVSVTTHHHLWRRLKLDAFRQLGEIFTQAVSVLSVDAVKTHSIATSTP